MAFRCSSVVKGFQPLFSSQATGVKHASTHVRGSLLAAGRAEKWLRSLPQQCRMFSVTSRRAVAPEKYLAQIVATGAGLGIRSMRLNDNTVNRLIWATWGVLGTFYCYMEYKMNSHPSTMGNWPGVREGTNRLTGDNEFLVFERHLKKKLKKREAKFCANMETVRQDDPRVKRLEKILERVLSANRKKCYEVDDYEMKIVLRVDDDDNDMKSFGTGNIYVPTRLMDTKVNDGQLAFLLGREVARIITKQDMVISCFSFSASVVACSAMFILSLSSLINKRMWVLPVAYYGYNYLEKERFEAKFMKWKVHTADRLGLNYAARACYDPTKIPLYLARQGYFRRKEGRENLKPSLPIYKRVLSGEFIQKMQWAMVPSWEAREKFVGAQMKKAIKIREKGGCPPLPRVTKKEATPQC